MSVHLQGPRTIKDVVPLAAGLGVSLFLGLFALSAWSRGLSDEPAAPRIEFAGARLQFPVPKVPSGAMADSFDARRGQRAHHAVDIFAPRHSPVVAVDDGRVARLLQSGAGGISVYQFDSSERYCYFYAHLESYAGGLAEGQEVKRGQLLGYVGSTGNASRSSPHLHFAISLVPAPKQWWGGSPIDPFPIWQ